MPVNVAVVGSGPSGFYAVNALLKAIEDVRVDIVERLPSPFGLIRGGVAPDHQTTKRVARSFERSAQDPRVAYYGNVELGRDLTVDDLREIYDAVILATGAPRDRRLKIPGADKAGVYGSAAFVGWYNGHPDFHDLEPDLDTPAAAVIGNGNVAINVARVLVKTAEEMRTSDLPVAVAEAIQNSPLTDVHLLGRRGPVEAKFTNVELREMGALHQAVPIVDPAQLPDTVPTDMPDRDRRLRGRNLDSLREFAGRDPDAAPKRVHFEFFSAPVEVLGGDRVEALKVERTQVVDGRPVGTGAFREIPCGLVVYAIGYRAVPIPGLPFDDSNGVVVNDDGRVGGRVYVVGWAKRGPTGVIGSSKKDGDTAARQIAQDVAVPQAPGREELERRLTAAGADWIAFADWQKIDAAEVAAAADGSPRRKFVTVDDMLAQLGSALR